MTDEDEQLTARQRSAQTRRKRSIEAVQGALIELLSENDGVPVTAEMVANKAGISTATVYSVFASHAAMYEWAFAELIAKPANDRAPELMHDPEGGLKIVAILVELCASQPVMLEDARMTVPLRRMGESAMWQAIQRVLLRVYSADTLTLEDLTDEFEKIDTLLITTLLITSSTNVTDENTERILGRAKAPRAGGEWSVAA